jgi:hypothetical protein
MHPTGFIEPCLPTPSRTVPDGPGWAFEVKHDGFRFIARREGDRVRVFSRHGKDWSDKVPLIVKALLALPVKSATLDGEGVVVDERGVTDFERLRTALAGRHSSGVHSVDPPQSTPCTIATFRRSGRAGPPSDYSLTLTHHTFVANDGLSGVCCRVKDCLARIGASLQARKVLRSVLSGVVFDVASHDQVMNLRGDAQGNVLRTAAAATGAGKIEHEDVGC